MIKASVYIICKNEERHIKRVLESVKDFDEIIIVDSGSSDKTLDIASNYTDKIYHQEWLGFSAQKEYAKNLCTNEWVLNLDSDEELSVELKKEIKQTIADDLVDGLDIKISGLNMGKFSNPLTLSTSRVRFFKKAKGYYKPKEVHESITLQGKTKKTKGLIYDYGTDNLEVQLNKTNLYSTLAATEKFNKGKKSSLLKLIIIFPLAFLKAFILRRGLLNGTRGFISAINIAYYAFLKEAKLYEMKQVK